MRDSHKFLPKLLWSFLALVLLLIPGCKGSYKYFTYRSKAEHALHEKNFKKAREYYSIIYQQENKPSGADLEKTTWAFYRLGVIAEVMGDVRMAKGYYWGDKIDEGFYEKFPETDRFAQAGWNWLDEGNPPRSIEEIFAFEAERAPSAAVKTDRKKREIFIPVQPRYQSEISTTDDNRPKRTFSGSLTPPAPGTKEPFLVDY